MRKKILWYVKRYGKAEVLSTVMALAFYGIARMVTDNEILCAYAMTMGENVGFYGIMIFREFSESMKTHKNRKLSGALKAAFNVVTEFGPAEALDSLILRPAVIVLGLYLLGNDWTGAIVGKIVADIVFYTIAALSREMRQKFFLTR